ncbi:hypothetical protein D3C87_1274880 [compost metagenome]
MNRLIKAVLFLEGFDNFFINASVATSINPTASAATSGTEANRLQALLNRAAGCQVNQGKGHNRDPQERRDHQ